MQSEYGRLYADLYRRHWWWRSRERMLVREIGRLDLPGRDGCEILDVGCGDGLFFPRLREIGRVEGIEIDTSLLRPAAENPDRALIHTRPLGDPEYAGRRFDLITALDVVEHIEDDAWAVKTMAGMLKPGGHLVITVPAFMALWDEHDVINQHFRRYTRSSLLRVLGGNAGLEMVRARYLFHAMFAPKLAVALFNKGRQRKVAQTAVPAGAINSAAAAWCVWEDRVLGGLGIPFGTSVLAVARRAE